MYRFAVWNLAQPFCFLWLLAGLAILLMWKKRPDARRRLFFLTIMYGLLTLLTLPAVAHLAIGSLEWQYRPMASRPTDTQAIVVLASYVFRPLEPGRRADLDPAGMYRCLRAAEIYHEGRPCPVVVSGYSPDPDPGVPVCAEVMRDFLVQLGVASDDLIVERESRTTYENALLSCKILQSHNWQRIVLVTDAVHLPRAAACFQKQGVDVTPCGCAYRATSFRLHADELVPDPGAARNFQRALHEWVGWIWYRIRGWA